MVVYAQKVFNGIAAMASKRSGIVRATKEGAIVVMGLVATRLFAFLVSVLIARASGVESFGEYTLFITVFILASEIPNAFDVAFIRFANAEKTESSVDEFLFMDLFSIILNAVIISVIAYYFAPLIADTVFNKSDTDSVIRAGAISGSIYCIFTTMIASYQQQHKFVYVSILRPIFNLCVMICVAVHILSGFDFSQKNLSTVYIVLASLFAIISLLRFRNVLINNVYAIRRRSKKFLGLGLLLLLSAAINQISGRLDVFILASYLSYDDLGIYGIAVRVSVFISLFTAMLITVMLPRAPKARANVRALKKYLALSLFYVIGQSVVAIMLIIWMKEFISLVFGNTYVEAAVVASILVVQVLFTSCAVPFQALIQCGDNPRRILWVNLTKMVMSIVLLPIFIHYYGISGAATALVLVAFITLIIIGIMALRIDRTSVYTSGI